MLAACRELTMMMARDAEGMTRIARLTVLRGRTVLARTSGRNVRLARRATWHVTLAFLGEVARRNALPATRPG